MQHIKVEKFDHIRLITFNWPEKKNSLTRDAYIYITELLNKDATDDSIITTIITGAGEYFSSGNNIGTGGKVDDYDKYVEESNLIFKEFVKAFLRYPKLLIAIVNGPAIGIAVTILPLCDVVYASDKATFYTPFVKLGIVAEACSTYTLQNIMGKSKACEMILLGHKMTAKEAYEFKLISRIIPHSLIQKFIEDLKKTQALPLKSLIRNKQLIKRNLDKLLYESNEIECAELKIALGEEDFFNAITAFMARKSKL